MLARAVRAPSGCLLWQGHCSQKGYGYIGWGSRTDGTRCTRLAHVVVWEASNGPVPSGLELDHQCKVRNCVELTHLEAVTHRENIARTDYAARSRRRREQQTHCLRGHAFDEANTRIGARGRRECRTCHRDSERARRSARREAA